MSAPAEVDWQAEDSAAARALNTEQAFWLSGMASGFLAVMDEWEREDAAWDAYTEAVA